MMATGPRHARRMIFTPCLLLVLMAAMLGCQPAGALRVHTVDRESDLFENRFQVATYRYEDDNNVTFVLIDGEPSAPRAAATIRVFWRPRAGLTPMDAAATNATIHYVRFADGDPADGDAVTIYSGAGFVMPHGKPGEDTFGGTVRDATLQLSDHTGDQSPTVTRAALSGRFNARRNDLATADRINQLNRMIRQRLGRPRLVQR